MTVDAKILGLFFQSGAASLSLLYSCGAMRRETAFRLHRDESLKTKDASPRGKRPADSQVGSGHDTQATLDCAKHAPSPAWDATSHSSHCYAYGGARHAGSRRPLSICRAALAISLMTSEEARQHTQAEGLTPFSFRERPQPRNRNFRGAVSSGRPFGLARCPDNPPNPPS